MSEEALTADMIKKARDAAVKAAGYEPADVKVYKFSKGGRVEAVLKDGRHVVIREGAQ